MNRVSPNPGPCSAGACIFMRNFDLLVDLDVGLGRGTNNTEELVALIWLRELIRLFGTRAFSKAIIFSEHAMTVLLLFSSWGQRLLSGR